MKKGLFHKRIAKYLTVICIITLIISAQAGSITAERVETSASVSGDGAVSGSSVISAGSTTTASVSVSGTVSTGSDPASFSYSDRGSDFGSDDFTAVGVSASRVSVSGSISGSGSASASAIVYAEGGEDSVPDPMSIWLNTFIRTETFTTADTPGSRATASASASGFAKGSGEWYGTGEIESRVSGSVVSKSNARSTTTSSSSSAQGMIGSEVTLASDGTSKMDAIIMAMTFASGDNADATASANGKAFAESDRMNGQSVQVNGKATGTSAVKNEGGAESDAMLVASSDPAGSTSMIFGTTLLNSPSSLFSGSAKASASGTAMTKAENVEGGYDTLSMAKGTATASGSQRGEGQTNADSLLIATVDHPEQDFAWDFDITPAGYIPDAGLFLHDLDADLSVKSALENSVVIEGTSTGFRGSAASSVKGSAISSAETRNELLSVKSDGSAQVKGSMKDPGFASGESGILSVLFKNVQSGTAGAYLDADPVSVPVSGSPDGSLAGGSLLYDQFSAQGSQAATSGSVKGTARSTGEGKTATTSGRSDGTLSGSVATTNSAEANTAGLLASVHAVGLEGPGFSNSLFDASVLVSESNAADAIDTTGTATGTVSGKTTASSEQYERMVQRYSSGSSVDGKAVTSVKAQKGTGLTVAGIGSVSLVQPVLDPATPDAFVKNAEGGVAYSIARGADPTARVTSSSEIRGTGSSEGEVRFSASGYPPFTLTGDGKVTISKANAVSDARTAGEAEAVSFGFTAQQAALTGTDGLSEGVAGFGTGTAGTDEAAVKADPKINRIDLLNNARVDSWGGAITPSDISVTFSKGAGVSKLDPLNNIGDTTTTAVSYSITFNPDLDAGGTAWGELVKLSKVITNDNPNVANSYLEGIASSAGPQTPVDLDLTPLLVGVYP